MCCYGYKATRHPLKNVRTHWTFKFGEIGLETTCDVYTAKLPLKTLNVYFLSISGKAYSSDNLDFTTMSGYLAYYPEDEEDHYRQDYKHWAKGLIYNTQITGRETDLIKCCMPKARYILDKLFKMEVKGNSKIYEVLKIWQEHPEIEYMIASEQLNIALDKRFWRLTDKKKQQVVKWIKDNKEKKNIDLQWVLDCINGVNPVLRTIAKKYKLPYGITEDYVLNIMEAGQLGMLEDYYSMCKELKKDLKDKYWLMPKDLCKAHEKAMEQLNNVKSAANDEDLKKIYDQFSKFGFEEGDYVVSVPKCWREIKAQADILRQCLLTCEYDKRMIGGSCILVFIKKKGNPIATMEITLRKNREKIEAKIGQFYMDERDRKNCLPTPEIRALGDKWFANYMAA